MWPGDFVDFVKREGLFATFLTPSEFAAGDENKRWDAARNAALSEILGFYGLTYWYTEQVTILGLGPIWQSENKDAKLKAADDLAAGEVMAFGLSEREHGADVYNTDMVLTPASEEDVANGILYRATGEKYYIGNGNVASMVSVFGRRGDVGEADAGEGYVFFAADSRHENYHLVDNVVHMQIYVSTFRLENYPVRAEDILHTGVEAFAAALNTVNIGKFNLCTCSIGMVEHAFYEAITHAQNRILYGNPVTDFAHVRANFVDSYARLVAMKLFSQRSVDYLRSASLDDRRYLLFNPVTKAKVTMEGENIAAVAPRCRRRQGLREEHDVPRGGTAHRGAAPSGRHRSRQRRSRVEVHAELHAQSRAVPGDPDPQRCRRRRLLLEAGPDARCGESSVRRLDAGLRTHLTIPNVARFYEQAQAFKEFLVTAAPDAGQQKDLDFLLNVGHLFSLIVYGQLILEQAALTGCSDMADIVDQIFDFQVRDFSRTRLRCMVSRARRRLSRTGRSARSANRCRMPNASAGSGNG